MKRKGKKRDKEGDYEAETKHAKTEWILCSEDWSDIVIMYVPQHKDIAIEHNYADISQNEIKNMYKQNKRRAQKKKKLK